MPTPHISAQNGEIAQTVIMPGDPLRAKYIADTFLKDIICFNEIRGMLGFTGTYQDIPVSVIGSGMGMPSMGIYSYELFTEYEVENIIRVGSCGAYSEELNLFDIILATGAWSESSYAQVQSGFLGDITLPDLNLSDCLLESALQQEIILKEGLVHSSDVFYRQENEQPNYWQTILKDKDCIAVEMESFALFHNAAVLGKNAACVLTVSDSFVTHEMVDANQREQNFNDMIKIALGAAVIQRSL